MTVGAIVLANMSAKPKVTRETYAPSASGTSRLGSTSSNSQPGGLASDNGQPSSTSSAARQELPAEKSNPASSNTPQRVYRNIDDDLKAAFDIAVREASTRSLNVVPTEDDSVDIGKSPVQPLVSREIKPSPSVAAIPSEPQAGNSLGSKLARTTTNLNMRSGPGPKFPLLQTLATNVPVSSLEEQAGWARIRLIETGQEGWVNSTFLRNE
ncbi:SH3 domain-containing protein [Rhizobium sp. CG4]|uniref:SH3 domain-containing protein n=1 Tax=Rhizobium sp. CG4 TaxID=2726075 RepID=UPI002033FC29|nr:SH3 domain-containing protein [Rhizobium sp. CG4]MCM2456511.1 SH3 domain-containing protein [Rhizobium sp. CG4]